MVREAGHGGVLKSAHCHALPWAELPPNDLLPVVGDVIFGEIMPDDKTSDSNDPAGGIDLVLVMLVLFYVTLVCLLPQGGIAPPGRPEAGINPTQTGQPAIL